MSSCKSGPLLIQGVSLLAGGQLIDAYSSDEEESPAHGFSARSRFSQSSTPVTTTTQLGGQGITSLGGKPALNG